MPATSRDFLKRVCERRAARCARLTAFLIFAGLALLAMPAAQADEEKVLNVYSWSDYIAPDTLSEFTKRTGIKVNYDVYDSNEALEAKLMVGKSGYDVVFPSAMPFFAKQINAGLYQKLDLAKIPNAKGVDPQVLARLKTADPQNAYGLPYLMAGTGIGYIKSKIEPLLPEPPIGSLTMLFDPKVVNAIKPCGVTLLDTPDEVFPAALAYLGKDPTSTSGRRLARFAPPTAISIRRATSTTSRTARFVSRSAMRAIFSRRESVRAKRKTGSRSEFFFRERAPSSTST